MSFLRSVKVAFTLLSCVAFSASAWEPRDPSGAVPLSAAEIKAAFAGQVANGQDITFVDYHYKDGDFKGVTSGGKHYGGEWWVEEEENYICFRYLSKMRDCYNIARGIDGNYYYYNWGSDRPDAYATLEPISE